MPPDPVPPALLYRTCDRAALGFATTDELEPLAGLAGQDRALEAIEFGVAIERPGYNLYVLGPQAAGKHTAVLAHLETMAATRRTPPDWIYVNNPKTPHQPRALSLPAGRGRELRDGMAAALDDLKGSVPAILESDEYQNRRHAIDEELGERQDKALEDLRRRAEAEGVALLRTPAGFALAPVREGKVMKPQVFNQLPEAERRRVEELIQGFQRELAKLLERLPSLQKERRDRIRELNREVGRMAVDAAMTELLAGFQDLADIRGLLEAVREDLIDNVELFVRAGGEGGGPAILGVAEGDPLRPYEINVIVDNSVDGTGASRWDVRSAGLGAPIIYENHPVLGNLVGRTEYRSQFGALTTDFTLIKAGALHRANGGYLVLDALTLLTQPLAWDALKRALKGRQITIESPGEYVGLVSTVSLQPDPIPLDVKVILVGSRLLYYLLCERDPDFPGLFKVAADFDDAIDRESDQEQMMARLITNVVREEELRPFTAAAVARIIEEAARHADDAEKLSLVLGPIADIVREADHFAASDGSEHADAAHVEAAVAAQRRRSDRVRERSLEAITRDIIMIETEGSAVGQINGLSVMRLGSRSFGRPSRITARTRMGGGGGARLVDIEREVELGGPIHSKGVLILSGYLMSTFLPERPVAMGASLVFEQSYGGVDGDSASTAELVALLSSLSGIPIRQGMAITGSINQMGEVQAIGGVNEKIEAFFDVCAARGLTGDQGVVIPAANVKNLMLRRDVVDAVERGAFTVYPVTRVEEAVELMTGVLAGERGEDGAFADGTVFAAAEMQLERYAFSLKRFAAEMKNEENQGDDGIV